MKFTLTWSSGLNLVYAVVMLHDLVRQAWISCLQILRLHRLMPTATPLALAAGYGMIHVWYNVFSFVRPLHKPWRQGKHRVCIKAASAIISNYITLVQVNPRYISLFIMPLIMLVFIGALFIKVWGTPPQFSVKKKRRKRKSSLKYDQDKNVEVRITEISGHQLEEDANAGNGTVRGQDIALFLTAALPVLILCSIEGDSGLVVSQFLLFLSSSMGELSMMLASLPSQVAPAFEVIHRASLVVVLLTAHTIAAEALGDHAVLVCLPELVAALVWVTIYLGHHDGSTTLRTVESVLSKANIPVQAICYTFLAYLGQHTMMVELMGESSDGATNLLSSYRDILVACCFSVVLLLLWLFALRQCWGQTKAGPSSSELEAAVRLLSFCRDTLFGAGVLCLVVYPLLVAPLRLQLQELAKDKWRDLHAATMTLF